MDAWAEKVANNILPLSKETSNLKLALAEWVYSGECKDYHQAFEECQMCEHPRLRYHYRIENKLTGYELWVGSECIRKFDVAVPDEHGEPATAEEALDTLNTDKNRAREEARKERVRQILRKLWLVDKRYRGAVHGIAAQYLQPDGAMTPKQMVLVAQRLTANNIPHFPKDFKVSLGKKKLKDHVTAMDQASFSKYLYPYLSSEQQGRASQNLRKG